MSAIGGDLRQLIESDQKAARPLLHDLVERLPKSAEARAPRQFLPAQPGGSASARSLSARSCA